MGDAIDKLLDWLPTDVIDEYDAAAATAGRLMAEVAWLRARLRQYEETITWHACCPAQAQATAEAFDAYQREQMLRDLVAETAAACAVWRKRAEAAEESLRFAYATKAEVPSETDSVCSVPGNAWDVIVRDRDEWKRRAEAAEAKLSAYESLDAQGRVGHGTEEEHKAAWRETLEFLSDAADVTDEEREAIKTEWNTAVTRKRYGL